MLGQIPAAGPPYGVAGRIVSAPRQSTLSRDPRAIFTPDISSGGGLGRASINRSRAALIGSGHRDEARTTPFPQFLGPYNPYIYYQLADAIGTAEASDSANPAVIRNGKSWGGGAFPPPIPTTSNAGAFGKVGALTDGRTAYGVTAAQVGLATAWAANSDSPMDIPEMFILFAFQFPGGMVSPNETSPLRLLSQGGAAIAIYFTHDPGNAGGAPALIAQWANEVGGGGHLQVTAGVLFDTHWHLFCLRCRQPGGVGSAVDFRMYLDGVMMGDSGTLDNSPNHGYWQYLSTGLKLGNTEGIGSPGSIAVNYQDMALFPAGNNPAYPGYPFADSDVAAIFANWSSWKA